MTHRLLLDLASLSEDIIWLMTGFPAILKSNLDLFAFILVLFPAPRITDVNIQATPCLFFTITSQFFNET